MSLLPIIYSSILIFGGFLFLVLLVSYIVYKIKGGAPNPATTNQRNINTNYSTNQLLPKIQSNTLYNQSMTKSYYPKESSRKNYYQPQNQTRMYRTSVNSGPRLQVLNAPVNNKIVVIKKSSPNYKEYYENRLMSYYPEQRQEVYVHA